MSKIERFEDLIEWQKARVLVRDVYKATRGPGFSRDFSLVDQIRRAATSIMSNIAEGFERGRRTEFHQYLVVAKGSCAEVRSELYVALDAGHLEQKEFNRLSDAAIEVGRIIGGLRAAVDPKSKKAKS